MKPKFNMTAEQNIFVAKRNIVDYIWKSARLEGLNVTFPETYAIYERAKLQDIDVDTVLVVNNLKHGWKYLLANLQKPLDLDFLCALNAEVARDDALAWGSLRTGKVGISGTDYKPPIPQTETVVNELNELNKIENATLKALKIMFWGMKSQLFWDGNKRVSMLAANKIMIESGSGIISVPTEYVAKFNAVLTDYYSNGTLEEAIAFVYEHCIDGIDFGGETKD